MDILNTLFEAHELSVAIRSSKFNFTPGWIEYHKELPRYSTDALLKIYNLIWNKGQLPADWKHSVKTPALKPNKNASDPDSYRPIALTSLLCKVMERMISTRLRWWMEDKRKFNKFQSRFRTQRSCEDHIIRLADDIHKSMNNRGYTLAVFLDLERRSTECGKTGYYTKCRSSAWAAVSTTRYATFSRKEQFKFV